MYSKKVLILITTTLLVKSELSLSLTVLPSEAATIEELETPFVRGNIGWENSRFEGTVKDKNKLFMIP